MTYKEVQFNAISPETAEILIAQLSEWQYEGFEEGTDQLKAFIPEAAFDRQLLNQLCKDFNITYTEHTLPDTNWNQLWESNFQPVIVDDFCAVRADFHEPEHTVQHEIIITPKMSFGTGHHPTTYMMIQQMRKIDFIDKTVFDFGTGTGVLAILAEKLGAKQVLAVDNDDWCIMNASENMERNNTKITTIQKADTAAADGVFDIILANINRNIILENFSLFKEHLAAKGTLLLSGLLVDDEAVIMDKAKENGFTLDSKLQRENWICLRLSRFVAS